MEEKTVGYRIWEINGRKQRFTRQTVNTLKQQTVHVHQMYGRKEGWLYVRHLNVRQTATMITGMNERMDVGWPPCVFSEWTDAHTPEHKTGLAGGMEERDMMDRYINEGMTEMIGWSERRNAEKPIRQMWGRRRMGRKIKYLLPIWVCVFLWAAAGNCPYYSSCPKTSPLHSTNTHTDWLTDWLTNTERLVCVSVC